MAKLAGIPIVNEQETFSPQIEATQYPVEKGAAISDHVQRGARTINVSGSIISHSAESYYNKLLKYAEKGDLVTYVGRMTAKNYIIAGMPKTYTSDLANGMGITIDLIEVSIAKSPFVVKKTKTNNKSKKEKVVKKNPSKKYHKVKKGDTYWALSKKYGTPLKNILSWNKWPPRAIPIGVNVRVK